MCKRFVLLIVPILYLVGCGDSGSTGPTPNTTTSTPVTQTSTRQLGEGSGRVTSQAFSMVTGSVGTPGELLANANWSVDEAILWMYIVDGACTPQQFAAEACPFDAGCECEILARSEAPVPKPRELSVPNFGPGGFGFIIWNVGDVDTNTSWQVRVRSTTSSSGPSSRSQSSDSDAVTVEMIAKKPPS